MIFKKYKERKAELQAEIEALETRKAQLEMELHDSENLRAYEKMYMEQVVLSKYDYAILVGNTIHPMLWNNGRFEVVRELDFHAEPGVVPELHITK